ncbi:MAG: glutamine synthetase, partial [Rhodovibrionaceae bacterium]
MEASQVKTAADAKKIVRERGLDYVKVGVFDIDGVLRGKYMGRDKFFGALDKGFGFCDVVMGWDSNDQLYDFSSLTGWNTGFPDAQVEILPGTCREIPFEDGMLLFLAQFSGPAEPYCPRGLLRRVIDRAAKLGFTASAACEFEFFVFDETPHSIREKNYRNLQNITPGHFGYSLLRSSVHAELYEEILETCTAMDMPIEGLHTETGAGVLEAALQYCDALAAADRAALFKTIVKVICQRQGRMATFMAKWSHDWPGQSGHIHLSLTGKNGKAAFYDAKKKHNISDTMRHFIGGQQALMPELLAMVAPTVNSFTRLIPGFWAPTAATWGIENRTCALRAIPGGEKSQRVEYRISAADINPYIATAAALGSGLWGIENEIEPDAPMTGNAYEKSVPIKRALPATLFQAAEKLKRSKPARDLFGDDFVGHYAQT